MNTLSDFEQAILDKLLAGTHPVLAQLREQAKRAILVRREVSDAGFFCSLELPPDLPAVEGANDFEIGDVVADIEGLQHGAGFVLFVRGGKIDLLEGFSYDEPWPKEISGFQLGYERVPRDLSDLVGRSGKH